jgi:hypothetical protein
VLGGVLEPGFVLPASAIAVAALVFSVVQGLGDGSMSGIARFADQGGELTTASLPSSFAPTRRNERLRTARARDFSNGRDFVARVERLATESDRRIQSGLRLQVPFAVVGSGSRIQIRFGEALTIRGSNSESGRVGNQNVWAPDLSGIMAGNERDWTSAGRLVAAERWGTSDVLPGSGVWSPTVAQGDFLMGRGDSVGSFGSQGRDPRDAWLALGFEDPTEFARYIAGRNLAEQELWATRLSERAEARGLLTEFLSVLRDSGDPTAAWVADDFSAQAELASQRSSEFAEQFTR